MFEERKKEPSYPGRLYIKLSKVLKFLVLSTTSRDPNSYNNEHVFFQMHPEHEDC